MEWFVELLGDPYDLEDLSNVCKSKELMVEKDEESFILKSTEFNNLNDGLEVHKKAMELVALINGASVVVLGLRSPLRASRSLIMVDDEGKKGLCYVCEPCTTRVELRGRFQTTTIKPDGSTEIIYQASPVPRWVDIAKRNEKVASVLKKLSENNLDFNELNIIFEHVQGDVGSEIKKWVNKDDPGRFTQTAQLYRHGESGLNKRKWKASQRPMALYEAKSFIESIVSRWIDSKVNDAYKFNSTRKTFLISKDFSKYGICDEGEKDF